MLDITVKRMLTITERLISTDLIYWKVLLSTLVLNFWDWTSIVGKGTVVPAIVLCRLPFIIVILKNNNMIINLNP